MNAQPTPEQPTSGQADTTTGAPAVPNSYGAPAAPMTKAELKRQKRMMKASRPWVARHKVLTGVLGIVGIAAVVGIAGGGDDEDPSADAPSSSAPASEPAEAPASSDPAGSGAATDEQPAADDVATEQTVVDEAAPEEAPADEEAAEEAPAEEPAASQVGVPVEVGDLELTVTGVEPGIASVGDQFLGAQAQGQFVRVDLTIANTGDRAETFWENDAVLVDTEGRQHSTSSDSIYLEDTSWLLTEINPGNTTNGALLFDIPADAEVDLLQVSAGLFSGDVEIRLR
ncbi:MAG: DUF4352 domain-containing protein [Actinomycetaceae bacterium]